jgi:hypothetical protein
MDMLGGMMSGPDGKVERSTFNRELYADYKDKYGLKLSFDDFAKIQAEATKKGKTVEEVYKQGHNKGKEGTEKAQKESKDKGIKAAGGGAKTGMGETKERVSNSLYGSIPGLRSGLNVIDRTMGTDIVPDSTTGGKAPGIFDRNNRSWKYAYGVKGEGIKGSEHLRGIANSAHLDPQQIKLANEVDGNKDLGDVLKSGDKDLIEKVTQGTRKLEFKGQKYTASEISALVENKQITVDSETGKMVHKGGAPKHPDIGGVGKPKTGSQSGEGRVKHEVGLSKEAQRLFKVTELADPSGISGKVSDALQKWLQGDANSKLNDGPIRGR